VQVRWIDRTKPPQKIVPDVFRVWLRTDYAPPMNSGRHPVAYAIDESEWNCAKSQIRYGPVSTYGTDGKLIVSGDDWEEWRGMRPGSLGEAQLKTLCGVIRSGKWQGENKK
jgi:hypothetical protein